VTESTEVSFLQERRGRRARRPLPQEREARLSVEAKVRAENVAYDAVTDGCFPLITNDREMTPPRSSPPTATSPTSNAATTC